MGGRLGLSARWWAVPAVFAVVIAGGRLLAGLAGLSDPVGLLILLALVGVWACVGFVRSERRGERERRIARRT